MSADMNESDMSYAERIADLIAAHLEAELRLARGRSQE